MKLFCREAYTNGESVVYHLANVGTLIELLLSKNVNLDYLSIHGPKDELGKIKPHTTSMNIIFFNNEKKE